MFDINGCILNLRNTVAIGSGVLEFSTSLGIVHVQHFL